MLLSCKLEVNGALCALALEVEGTLCALPCLKKHPSNNSRNHEEDGEQNNGNARPPEYQTRYTQLDGLHTRARKEG